MAVHPMTDHYDALETRDPAAREREQCRAAARDRQTRHERAGLGQASRRRRSEIGHLARRVGQPAGAAQVRYRGPAEGQSAVRRPQRHRARQGAPAADVAGPDLRAGRARAPTGGAPRARSMPPASAPATWCTIPLPITSRPAASFSNRRACARLRGHPGRRRQYRAAIGSDRALPASGLCRHAGFPENPARHRREDRQGGRLDQARPGVRRGAAGLAARRAGQARRRGAAMLRHRRARRDLLRVAGARRHDRQRDDDP